MENALCKSFDSSRLGFRKIQRDFFVQADEALHLVHQEAVLRFGGVLHFQLRTPNKS